MWTCTSQWNLQSFRAKRGKSYFGCWDTYTWESSLAQEITNLLAWFDPKMCFINFVLLCTDLVSEVFLRALQNSIKIGHFSLMQSFSKKFTPCPKVPSYSLQIAPNNFLIFKNFMKKLPKNCFRGAWVGHVLHTKVIK